FSRTPFLRNSFVAMYLPRDEGVRCAISGSKRPQYAVGFNGLPERFPKLKVMWLESGLAWIPFMMQGFDNEYMMRTSEAPALKRLPSDYMREMYFASQPLEITDMGLLQETFRVINA